MKILIIQNYSQLQYVSQIGAKHDKLIRSVDPDSKIVKMAITDPGFEKQLQQTEVVITQTLANVPLDKSPNLKWIHLSSAGVNGLNDQIKKSKIIVTNSSGVHPIPISEHVLAFMLMFARGIIRAFRIQIEKEKWVKDQELLPVDEIFGKTVCIVGMGKIGTEIARLSKAFGLKVIGITRSKHQKQQFVDELGLNQDLDKFLKQADFVINCLPLTDETQGLFNKQKFKLFKKTSVFINIGRGQTVVEQDLIEALKNQVIAGAGLDVFETEPLPSSSELWKLKNVILTSHYSSWSPNYADRMIDIFCQNLKAFLNKQKMPTQVDKQAGY